MENIGKPHGKYNSSDNTYYKDVVFNLLHCQNGVCAYTEVLLCAGHLYEINCWENGCYKSNSDAKKFGSLDHFNSDLKKDKAWLWDNLFMVHSDINRNKSKKDITILPKPDADMLLKLMAFSNVPADRVLMIGDTTHDLDLARNAGVSAVGVGYGAHSRVALSTRSSVVIVENVTELTAWLMQYG